MGVGSSASHSESHWDSLQQEVERARIKGLDGSDLEDMGSARDEVCRLRRLLDEIGRGALRTRANQSKAPPRTLQRQFSSVMKTTSTVMLTSSDSESASAATLRIIHINDVYELENLSRFATLVKESSVGFEHVIVTLSGDFLGPSVLSALDGGRGMVDVLNAVGVTHVCFGNHENDVPYKAQLKRVNQFKGKWINSNMRGFDVDLPTHDVIEVKSRDGTHVRRVGLLGLMLHSPTIHRRGAFGGAVPSMTPVNETAQRMARELVESGAVDAVVPLTHQDMADDVILSKSGKGCNFPVILGAHDHDLMIKSPEHDSGCLVVKVGSDAYKTAIIDVTWATNESPASEYTVEMSMLDVCDYTKDMEVESVSFNALRPVRELKEAVMLRTSQMRPSLSSIQGRTKQTTMGTLLTSALRDAMRADVCLLNAGGIRGNATYEHEFTYFDLKNEIAFTTYMVVVAMEGKEVASAVKESRSKLPMADGGFLQLDGRCEVAGDDTPEKMQELIVVAGSPLELEREYLVATDYLLLTGLNNIPTLKKYGDEHPEIMENKDACSLSKPTLVQYFAKNLIRAMGGLEEIDLDHDGIVTEEEVEEALKRLYADKDGDGKISVEEAMTAPTSVPNLVVNAVMDVVEDMTVKAEGKEVLVLPKV